MRISDWSSDVCSSDLVMACACAAPFRAAEMRDEVRSALPYSALTDDAFARVLGFIRDGGYALKAYDRFKRLTQDRDGIWRVSHPRFVQDRTSTRLTPVNNAHIVSRLRLDKKKQT